MKKFLPLIFVLFTSFVFSQTNRFFYELKSRNNATEDYKTNVMVLDINPTSVKFYDKDLLDYDSINKSKNGTSEYRTNTKTDQLVIRKPNSFKNNWYRDFKEYFVVHSNDEMTWKLNKDTLNYRGYILQKATTNFGGRVWTAWFSQEIPISEGPYKFQGLPGFIFLLNDSENNFVYKLLKNVKLKETYDTTGFLEKKYDKKPLVVTNEQFNKYVVDFYENPTRQFGENMKNNGTATFQGKQIKNQEELNAIKQNLQKFLKDMFIYVERDKAPKFNGE